MENPLRFVRDDTYARFVEAVDLAVQAKREETQRVLAALKQVSL
jgi:hypothetical protein